MGHREPAHARRFHERLYGAAGRQPFDGARDEGVEGGGLEAEADRATDGSAVVVDLGHLIAADGEIDADGA
jgi:hypothetical protein